jgi:PKD repeat protein
MFRKTIVVALLFIPAAPAAAQTPAEKKANLTIQSKALLDKAPDPTATNGIVTPDAKFTFAAGPDGKEARVQIGIQSGGLTTSLSFKGKLAEKGVTALFGLTGLNTDASGAIAFSYTRWNPTANEARAFAVCDAYNSRRLAVRRADITRDQGLLANAEGRWSLITAGDAGHITWEFGDGAKDYDLTTVAHAYEKPGVYQVKVVVETKDFTATRSWLVAVSKGAVSAAPAARFARREAAPRSMQADRVIPFTLTGPASKTATADYGDGTKEKVAVGSAGSILLPHRYEAPGQYAVSAGVELGDDQFAVVSSVVRVSEDCAISAMGSEPDLQKAHALAVNWSLPLIVAAKYEMGRSSYEFVDAKTGAEQPGALRTPIGASGTVGTIFENGVAVAFSVERQRSYKAGKSAQLCADFAAGIVKCDDVVLGGPASSDATVASITLQKAGKNVGVQPRLSYRWTASRKITSVDVPIYVLQNKDGGLNGGVSLGWRTKDGARAVLFVGVMTDLFQRK